jgi:hypothetical protein
MRVFFRLEKAMARQEITLGTPPTGLGGDTPRVASSKINAMTLELYQGVGTPAAPLPLERGGTGATTQAGAQSALGLPKAFRDSVKAGEVLTVGHAGWNGGIAQVMGNGSDCNALVTAMIYALNGTYTNGPPNFSGNALFLRNTVHGAGYLHQEAYGITQSIRAERIQVNGAWGSWRVMYNDFNALSDPAGIGGGLMSSATVSGYNVYKYANGLMCIQGLAPNVIPSVASNTSYTFQIALPVAFINANFTGPVVTVLPAAHNDHYGVVPVMTSGGVIFCILRNGAGAAQTFSNVNVTVWGRWK